MDFWHFRFQFGGNCNMLEMFGEISFLGWANYAVGIYNLNCVEKAVDDRVV